MQPGLGPHFATPIQPGIVYARSCVVTTPILGLNMESARNLDIIGRGSFTHKTPTGIRKILDQILEKNFLVCESEPLQDETELRQEETLAVKSEPLPSASQDSTPKSRPNHKYSRKKKFNIRSSPIVSRKKSLNITRTTNYFNEKRQLVLDIPSDPLKDKSLKETHKDLTSILSSKWLRKWSYHPKEFELAPSLTTQYQVQGNMVNALYNPTIGANIVLDSFVQISSDG